MGRFGKNIFSKIFPKNFSTLDFSIKYSILLKGAWRESRFETLDAAFDVHADFQRFLFNYRKIKSMEEINGTYFGCFGGCKRKPG